MAGAFVFITVGLVALSVWRGMPPSLASLKAEPAFQIADNAIQRRPQISNAFSQRGGWVESLQYGQLSDRDIDMSVLLVVPNEPYRHLTRSFAQEISDLGPLANRSFYGSSDPAYYDLETRFGNVRAAQLSINADGRIKLCASFVSRFDSGAFYYKGWYCEANGARPNFHALACTLDQLQLKRPLPSAQASAFITERMKRPARCMAEPVSQTTDAGSGRRAPLKRLIR